MLKALRFKPKKRRNKCVADYLVIPLGLPSFAPLTQDKLLAKRGDIKKATQ
jgi:hypothetical protein